MPGYFTSSPALAAQACRSGLESRFWPGGGLKFVALLAVLN